MTPALLQGGPWPQTRTPSALNRQRTPVDDAGFLETHRGGPTAKRGEPFGPPRFHTMFLVPAVGLGVAPRAARVAVAVADVAEAPLDLGGGVGLPVAAGRSHLVAGQSLRDSVRAGAPVPGRGVPAALLGEQLLQASHLLEVPAGREDHGAPCS